MSEKIILCKKCKKQIDSGKYCKRCVKVRSEDRDKALKTVGGVLSVVSIALVAVAKVKLGENKKL